MVAADAGHMICEGAPLSAIGLRTMAGGIEYRLTQPDHPWTNDQVARLNQTIKYATVKRSHYDSHGQLRMHLADFMDTYSLARRLKTLRGLTPCEYICKIWTSEPDRFILKPETDPPDAGTEHMGYGLRPRVYLAPSFGLVSVFIRDEGAEANFRA